MESRSRLFGQFALVVTTLILPAIFFGASAQETSGGLTGRVSDQSGRPLAGVIIKATHLPSGTFYGTTTTGEGRFIITNLRIGGPYQVTASQIGMRPQSRDSVIITLGTPSTLNFLLSESTQELTEVVVKASRGGIRANTTGAGTNISSAQLRSLPSSSRSLQDYTRLTPQFNGNSFAGTNFRYNNVTIDGAINNDAIGFSPSLGGQIGTSGQPGSSTRSNPISLDAIQDIQVYLAPFDIKIGNFTGGSINAVTRSGTNQFSGSVYALARNASLAGNDVATGTGKLPSTFHDLQIGFRFGFPIIKNKLFLFTNEELSDRRDPIVQTSGSPSSLSIFSSDQPDRAVAAVAAADSLRRFVGSRFGFDPGSADAYTIYSKSTKFFNRLDWNLSSNTQLSIRNNTVLSEATNLERDEQNFRFSSLDYKQINNQNSTVAELKSRFNNRVSNSLVVGYSSIHDYREPTSNAYYPQIQIGGRTLGTFILYGTDREASVFNLKQRTLEITDNLTWFRGRHTFTLGTHNELYHITYGFVNSPNGRIDYDNVESFYAGQPARIRGNFAYQNQTRQYSIDRPSADFRIDLLSAYLQDEIQINERLRIVPGFRIDYAYLPEKPVLSSKTRTTVSDLFYGGSYNYTNPTQIQNDILGRPQLSPRLGLNYDVNGDKSLVFRGGSGLFTGRIPFAWLGYAYYNNGNTYGAFDRRYDYTGNPSSVPPVPPTPPDGRTDPRRIAPNGIAESAFFEGGPGALNPYGVTQVDLIDNKFKMPQVWRSSAALDWTFPGAWKLTLEGLYTKTIQDVKFQQINHQDSAGNYLYDLDKRQPIFNGKTIDPQFTAVYLLSNSKKGYRYSGTLQLSKSARGVWNFSVAYTYGVSKDLSNGIRNSAESNWQLNQALNPNNPDLAFSNFDIRHRAIASGNYVHRFGVGGRHSSGFALFFSAASGQPFTYGFVNTNPNIQRTGQQVSLAYIPQGTEFARFFRSGDITLSNGDRVFKSAADQGAEFFRYVADNAYLRSRQGMFTERNAARTPWNINSDFRFTQIFALGDPSKSSTHTVTFTYDIFNLTNLIFKNLGKVYFASNLFNSTASVGLRPASATTSGSGYPAYVWEQPASPYQVDPLLSRWQMQLGLRYSF